MPLFSSKFAPKKAPLRKNATTTDDQLFDLNGGKRVVKLNLGNQNVIFDNGEWVPEIGENAQVHKFNKKLEKKIQNLQEENNLLKLKYNIMLNMLTQSTAENHIQERELNKLRVNNKDKNDNK